MHSDYHNPIIRQLRDQQVRFAPREKKIEQVNRAEKLLAELDAGRTYTYEYLCYRITDYRPESFPNLKLSGSDAGHDLRLFVEDLSDAADVPAAGAGERVLTVEELSKHVQGLDQDHFAVAPAGSGQPPVRVRRPQASRFFEELGRAVRGARTRTACARRPFQPTDRSKSVVRWSSARGGWRGPAAAWPKSPSAWPSRMGRSVETIRYTLEAVRPGASRSGDLPGPHRSVERRRQAADLPAVSPRCPGRDAGQALSPHQDQRLSRDQRDARPADHGAAAGLHSQSAVSAGRGIEKTILAPMPANPTPGQEDAAAERACRRTWPACTKCRC